MFFSVGYTSQSILIAKILGIRKMQYATSLFYIMKLNIIFTWLSKAISYHNFVMQPLVYHNIMWFANRKRFYLKRIAIRIQWKLYFLKRGICMRFESRLQLLINWPLSENYSILLLNTIFISNFRITPLLRLHYILNVYIYITNYIVYECLMYMFTLSE